MAWPHAAYVDLSQGQVRKHLPRPRVLSKLLSCVHYRVTLLCAPAGAGKSTLLNDLAESTHVPTILIQLDRSARDPAVLVRRLLERLGVKGQSSSSEGNLTSPAWKSAQSRLPSVANALLQASQQVEGELLLLLDDYHKVDDSDGIGDFMAGLLELMPPGVHLVLSSRTVPELPLARLRLEGQLLEIVQGDLILDPEELSAFLATWAGHQLSPEEEKLVLDKTGGWIAGVSLLVQSLRNHGGSEMMAFLKEFSGSTDLVYDYFAEEVFRQQSAATQQFLMATSLLGNLDGELVDGFLGIGDGQNLLESLAASNIFMVSLDNKREWYRYHPLFRDFLRARALRSFGQSRLRELHRVAAAVYSQRGDWSEAIDHLCLVPDFEEAARIVEREGESYLERGYLETVRRWIGALPERIRQERPSLLMIEGIVAIRQGRYREAMRYLTQSQTLFAEAGDAGHLATVAASRAMAAYRLRNYREAVDLLEFSLASALDPARRALTLARLCTYHKELGDLDRSVRFGEASLKELEVMSSVSSEAHPGIETRSLRYLAEAFLLRGDLDRSLALLLKAADLSSREQIGDVEQAYVRWAIARIRAIRGEAELALRALQEAENDVSYVPPLARRVRLWKGNVLTDLGDFAAAEEYYESAGFPPAERAWLYVRQQQPGRAILLAEEALLDPALEREPLGKASLTTVLGLATAATGKETRALDLLREAEEIFESHGYAHHLASLRLHLARLMVESDEPRTGLRMLIKVLETAENQGFLHFYWWDPVMVAGLLTQVQESERLRRYVERLVAIHPGEADRQALHALITSVGEKDGMKVEAEAKRREEVLQLMVRTVAGCKDSVARARIESAVGSDPAAAQCVLKLHSEYRLTWREIEVFAIYYLDRRYGEVDAHGSLRKEYAGELCMTENTLKSHVKRIRRKLDLPDGADSLQVYRQVVDRWDRKVAPGPR